MKNSRLHAKQIVIFLSIWLLSLPAYTADLTGQRLDYLKAERLLSENDSVNFLNALDAVEEYPLYPYLKAKWLSNHLDQAELVSAYLRRFEDTLYADQLRARWVGVLARQQRWQGVITHYRATDGLANQCYYNQARYVTGQKIAALAATKRMWLLGKDLPAACDFLLREFKASTEFSDVLVWARFEAALQKNQLGLARYLKGMLDNSGQVTAEFWLNVHSNPAHVQSVKFSEIPATHQPQLFVYAVQRLARKAPGQAVDLWEGRSMQIAFTDTQKQLVARTLGMALATNKLPGAFERLMQVASADQEVKEWRVRAALNERRWPGVLRAIDSLSGVEQTESNWRYWQARAYWELNKKELALPLFKQLATDASYYGFLAADYAQVKYTFTDNPVIANSKRKATLLASDAFKIVQEFRHLGRNKEAEKQWWYVIKRLDKDDIKAAAIIARDWQWQHIAIFTIAKAKDWDDIALRFPIAHQQSVEDNAISQTLDPAIIFGLIRQESAFDHAAGSYVGARGLMQIMPATGKQIARELEESWSTAGRLFDPAVNIKYGAYYYSKLLQRFNGHFALAVAAYNAGPNRVATWKPLFSRVSADVWVETIPFKETRKYVARVLSYALIYQHRLHREAFKMHDLMRDVLPTEKLS